MPDSVHHEVAKACPPVAMASLVGGLDGASGVSAEAAGLLGSFSVAMGCGAIAAAPMAWDGWFWLTCSGGLPAAAALCGRSARGVAGATGVNHSKLIRRAPSDIISY